MGTDFLLIILFFFLFASCVLSFFLLPPCVCVVRMLAILDRGRLTEVDEGPDWLVDPLHISQLKEQYRRDRAKNKKGLARKFKLFVSNTKIQREDQRDY